MAARDNPYYIQPPNIYDALMAGVGGYDKAQTQLKQDEMDAVLKQVGQEVARGGISDSALGQLFGIAGAKGVPSLNAAANLQKSKLEAQGVYGNPIILQKPDGTYAVGAIGKHGEPRIIDFGGGMNPTVPSKSVDTGTGTYVIPGRVPGGASGAVAPQAGAIPQAGAPAPGQTPMQGYYPKDVAGASEQRERGKDIANAQTDYAALQSKLPGLQTVVKQLDGLAEKATYTEAGKLTDVVRRQLNITPRDAAVARSQYISMIDNQILPLLRITFGAQFTEREGATLRATLGDPDKAPKEKQAILKSFIEQKVRDVGALRSQATSGLRPAQGGQQPIRMPSSLTPQGAANWIRSQNLQSGTPVILPDGTPGVIP